MNNPTQAKHVRQATFLWSESFISPRMPPRDDAAPAFDSQEITLREQFINALKSADRWARAFTDPEFYALLRPAERLVQSEVDRQAFLESAWYRPVHNRVVPLIMRRLLLSNDAPADLMFAAQLHDIGYAMIRGKGAPQRSAQWSDQKVRDMHPRYAAEMTLKILGELVDSGQLAVTTQRIFTLSLYVRDHDKPYWLVDLRDNMNREEQLVRDADRGFVMSLVSFWKDFACHLTDPAYRTKMAEKGLEFTPSNLLACRAANFYGEGARLPKELKDVLGDVNPALADYNEGRGLEEQYSSAGRAVVDEMFSRRANEVQALEQNGLDAFLPSLHARLLEEMKILLKQALPQAPNTRRRRAA